MERQEHRDPHSWRSLLYAYRVHSEYDPVKKRSRKVTDEYLGKVTPDGIIITLQ